MPQPSDVELNSLAGGSYRANTSIIRIDPLMSIWSDPEKDNLPKLGIFLHEYMHYLHNYSTYSGLFDFVSHVRLAKLFTNTVAPDGTSQGAKALPNDEQQKYLELVKAINHVRGRARVNALSIPDSKVKSVKLTGIQKRRIELNFDNSPPLDAVEVTALVQIEDHSGNLKTERFEIGSIFLLESAAWEIEKIIYERDPSLLFSMESTVNLYPYKFARLLFREIGQIDPSPATLAKACLLALQSSDPANTFLELVKAISERIKKFKQDEEQAVEECAEVNKAAFKDVRQLLVEKMIMPELHELNGRKGLGHSLNFHRDICIKYLDLRIADQFFELRSINSAFNFERLNELLASHPPCPIIEANETPKPESSIFFVSAEQPSELHIQSLGTFQSFMQFMQQHLHPTGFLATENLGTKPCTFFGACINPTAIENSEICLNRPWKSFNEGKGRCWYAAGVTSAIKVIAEPSP